MISQTFKQSKNDPLKVTRKNKKDITKLSVKNSELKIKVAKLSCNFEEIKSKRIITNSLEQLSISEKKTVSIFTGIENSNNTSKQINLQTQNILTSDISDNTSNSDISLSLIDNTSE
ncbi:8537_t:CDS:2 [Diversispora eburnea]|uniref:8537_t:CDS:1 n=1 Tax=Diversispora eburnea TaxID=1213867 RepID=A0A9N8V696_9GLOM|nr:8537_t:CDS:2 [Diversispora eburnea]